MNRVLKSFLDKLVVVFIYGIFVYSRTKEEHVNHLRVVSQEGISVDPTKIEAIVNWQRPLNMSEV